jgi:hypothetical protein
MNEQQILMLMFIAFILYLAATGRLRTLAGVISGRTPVNSSGNPVKKGTEPK